MRKFCWVYKHRKTGEVVLAQRPRRRALNPTYWVQRVLSAKKGAKIATLDEVPSAKFRLNYVYVGRLRSTA